MNNETEESAEGETKDVALLLQTYLTEENLKNMDWVEKNRAFYMDIWCF